MSNKSSKYTTIVQKHKTPDIVEVDDLCSSVIEDRVVAFTTPSGVSLRVLVEQRSQRTFGFRHVVSATCANMKDSSLTFEGHSAKASIKKALDASRDVKMFNNGRDLMAWWLEKVDA